MSWCGRSYLPPLRSASWRGNANRASGFAPPVAGSYCGARFPEHEMLTAARIALPVLAAAIASPAAGQSIQYTSPAGVAYRSQSDTGPVARAQAALRADSGNIRLIIA